MTHPWERRAKESAQQYEAFRTYLELGVTRSLQKANDALGRPTASVRHLKEWSVAREWVARVRAWDEHHAEQRRTAFQAESEAATQRWIKQAVALQVPAALMLQELQRRLEADELDLSEMDAAWLVDAIQDTAKTWKVGLDVERLARGLETERIHHQGSVATGPDPLLAAVLEDPEARLAAEQLIARLSRKRPVPA